MVSLIVPLDMPGFGNEKHIILDSNCLLYTSDAADE